MFPLTNKFDFLPHKFTGLGGWRLAFTLCTARSFQSIILWHDISEFAPRGKPGFARTLSISSAKTPVLLLSETLIGRLRDRFGTATL
jgi:hypothetical protein